MSSADQPTDAPSPDADNSLVGDLESLRSLLDEPTDAPGSEAIDAPINLSLDGTGPATETSDTDTLDTKVDAVIDTPTDDPDASPLPPQAEPRADSPTTAPGVQLDMPIDPPTIPDDAHDVPVLDDMLDGALSVDESPLLEPALSEASFASFSTDSPDALGDETIKALLGDEWRRSADKILSTARNAIETVASKWSPQQTTELNEALRVRIDATLEDWLEVVVQQRMDDLRATLLDAIETEISEFTDRLQQQDSDGE